MRDYEAWFREQLEEFRDDPEAVADEVSLQIIADIYQAMLRHNMTKKELAGRVGVSPAFVSQVLNGKPNLTLLTLAKFAIALDLDCHVHLTPRVAEPEAQTKAQAKAAPKARRKPLQPASPRRSRRAVATPA